MPKGDVETFHENGTWHNHVTGEAGNTGETYRTQAGAAEEGRQIAASREVEHIIKDKDGQVSERNSYGKDPRDVKG
ncbi:MULTISPECIES: DUF2188 domain-containing protein [unclassified Microbacterium]|uniref:DUF2188 domain-containing protein n=1 Tax=unclassified Microbacterium TaxID=2609290 RepID=UPI001D2A2DB5|nr:MULTISPECIES: DUF2188 domain-containing protein [unclassified Microbacterium]CAH0190793.1 hypothetical protein SRABI121_02236 [Microbacterium sp. Bi121]